MEKKFGEYDSVSIPVRASHTSMATAQRLSAELDEKREKVITALKLCIDGSYSCCLRCPYAFQRKESLGCRMKVMLKDALEIIETKSV